MPTKLMKRAARIRESEQAPDAPHVMARWRRGRLLLEFDFRATPEPPRWLVATVNSQDEKAPPHAHPFGVENVVLGSLDTRIELDPKKHYDVSLAVVDDNDRPAAPRSWSSPPVRGGADFAGGSAPPSVGSCI